jgi:hypothetical protein
MLSEAGEIGGATDGYFPVNGTGVFDVSQPPDLTLNHPYIEHYSAALADFNLWPENLAGLETILSLDSATTHVILVEMPVTETFHRFFGKGPQDYRLFVDTMAQRTAAHHIPLWRMQELERLPSPVWYNYNHLNADGAPIFSRWLGEKLAQVSGTALSEKP